jgi:hypothetical protein
MQIAMSGKPTASLATFAAVLAIAGLPLASCGDDDSTDGGHTGVTADQFEQIPSGAAEGEIRYELGEPAAEREIDDDLCLEYPESKGSGLGRPRTFRFCFRDGMLVAKKAY